ncbi:hypothetical protein BDF14DRAFT_729464 [Spinellus fusiger]|nr:hypothetical protein BDF14DRAFT_729464 [Spinellus fusiger]
MDEATKSADNIRLDIRELKSRFAVINAIEKCYLCDFSLLTRQFYAFPCQHAFHADCLIDKTTKYLPTRQIRRLADIQEQLSREIGGQQGLAARPTNANNTTAMLMNAAGNLRGAIFPTDNPTDVQDDPKLMMARTEQLKEELDDIVAGECVLCGDIMIKSIDQPFLGEEEAELIASWAI